MGSDAPVQDSSKTSFQSHRPGFGDCWNTVGVSGDRSCPELSTHVHCRNCPVFAGAARSFFDRPAPDGYLADWSGWLAESATLGPDGDRSDVKGDNLLSRGEAVSVLIFRLGQEWLAFGTQTIAEVTLPRPVHRIPHRSNAVFSGIVSLQGQVQLCVSLHGLLGATATPGPFSRLVVLHDLERGETWVFTADEVVGVRRIPRTQWRNVPSTLMNPAVGFSQAVLSCDERSIGLLDEQRVFGAIRSLRP
jgi:chemotaxis-related protein WspD